MARFKLSLLVIMNLLVSVSLVHGQTSRVAVVDFEKAIVESVEGKKSSDKFNGTLQAKQAEGEKRQKELEDAQRKLQTQERTLSDTGATMRRWEQLPNPTRRGRLPRHAQTRRPPPPPHQHQARNPPHRRGETHTLKKLGNKCR